MTVNQHETNEKTAGRLSPGTFVQDACLLFAREDNPRSAAGVAYHVDLKDRDDSVN
jgi:hypothetical protein